MKFLLILNEKKKKIRELKEELEISRSENNNCNNNDSITDDHTEGGESNKNGKRSTKVNFKF